MNKEHVLEREREKLLLLSRLKGMRSKETLMQSIVVDRLIVRLMRKRAG